MSIFEADKQSLIIRQVAEMYGIRPVCYGMAVSLFHNDQKRRIKPHIRDPTECLCKKTGAGGTICAHPQKYTYAILQGGSYG